MEPLGRAVKRFHEGLILGRGDLRFQKSALHRVARQRQGRLEVFARFAMRSPAPSTRAGIRAA
jgi:hypothetical protein